MGRTMFTCAVPTTDTFDAAIAHICIHNNVVEMKPMGETYSDEEFAAIDPMRARVCEQLKDLPSNAIMGCKQKWTRGEDIEIGGYVIQYRDQPWLVVRNNGGGACTTRFLQKQFASTGWYGTDSKPDGWIDASVIAEGSFGDLRKRLFPDAPEESIVDSLEKVLHGC
jgi:hypothetical protein